MNPYRHISLAERNAARQAQLAEPNIVAIEFVDYGAQGEYGLFGKVVVISDVEGYSASQRAAEVENVRGFFGEHLVPREIEHVPAAV